MLNTISEKLIERPNILIGAVTLIISIVLFIALYSGYQSKWGCEAMKEKVENSKGKSNGMVYSLGRQAYNRSCGESLPLK